MNRIFIRHIRSFWARWCPLYMRILIFFGKSWESRMRLHIYICAYMRILQLPMRCARLSWDLCDSSEGDRATEVTLQPRSGARACARGPISHARTCHGRVYTTGFYIFCFLSREFWLIPSTWSDNAASTRRWIWRQITIRSSDEKETVASMVGLERWYTILLKDYTHV